MKSQRVVRMVVFSSMVFLALLFVRVAPAGAHGMHGGPVGFYLMNQDRLGLSADQVAKLQAINMKFQKVRIMERARIHVIRMEGMQLLMQKDVNTSALKKDLDRVLKHKRALMMARIEMVAKAHQVLTAAQFEKVKKLWRQMMMMHHEMHPMMGHPGPMSH